MSLKRLESLINLRKGQKMKNNVVNRLLNVNLDGRLSLWCWLIFAIYVGYNLFTHFDVNTAIRNTFYWVVVWLGLSFIEENFAKKPSKYYINLLIKRISKLCHQYKSSTVHDNFVEQIISDVSKKLENDTRTLGFYLCKKYHYKGKLVQSYLEFIEKKIADNAFLLIDDEEKRIKEQTRQNYEIDEIKNIDAYFGRTSNGGI